MVRENNDPCIGIGGGPTRCSTLPVEAAERKKYPVATGVLDYFPDAIAALAQLSWKGNEQHNPGQPLHWARGKSADEPDTCIRHFMQRGTRDADGVRHSVKALWRMAAIVQKEIEEEGKVAEEKKPIVGEPGRTIVLGPNEITTYEPPAHEIKDVKTVMDDHHVNYMPAMRMGIPENGNSFDHMG